MMNLFTLQTLQLSRRYVETYKYSHDNVLKNLVLVAYSNGGYLPESFSFPVKYGSKDTVNEVLEDLGYPRAKNFFAFKENVHVEIDI